MTKPQKSPPWITLGYLISRYRRPSNPRWADLAPRTRSYYQEVFNWLASYRDLALADIDLAVVETIRAAALEQRTWSFANCVLKVMKVVFNWAAEKQILIHNPAASLKLIERPENLPEANRVWTDEECEIMLSEARGGLRVALALGLYAALRISVIVELPWSAYDGTAISRGRRHFVHPELKTILDETQRIADTIVTNEHGKGYSLSGLKRAFRALRDRLVAEGKIKPGLTLRALPGTAYEKRYPVVAAMQYMPKLSRNTND
jgi:integrase